MPKISLQLHTPAWPYECANLVEVARAHAKLSPDTAAIRFVDYATETPQEQLLTYELLDRRARQIAALLQTRARAGGRVLLLYPAGLDYVCAFFGCLYAGMIAVPAYPPLNPRLRTRLAAVALDCDATIALTTAATLQELGERSSMLPPLARLHWFTTDGGLDAFENAWDATAIDRSNVAFLQYTSGSTGTPKGVMVTHGNLLHNLHGIALQMQFQPYDHVFSWLPPYHDMGLIGSVLAPFCADVPLSFVTPLSFLRRPARWLREISARQCTISGAPNFAYELCLNKIPDDELGTLDLSKWSLAFSGAEPVKLETVERFVERFGPCGFERQAFYPCYGMAESTLIVTGKRREEMPKAIMIDRATYARDRRAVMANLESHEMPETQSVVSCGAQVEGLDVAIVDPITLTPLNDGDVGEILVSGESITAGYWNRELETLATFAIQISGKQGNYLRTGDLGFKHDGELYVSGRLKDMIIIRGINHYPQDIESAVDRCHEAIRSGCGICFSIDLDKEERLVFVQEVGRRDKERSQEIIQAIRAAIIDHHEIHPYAIVLVENGSIHKTTSGKLSRRPCRDDFLNDRLPVVEHWKNPAGSPSVKVSLEY